MTELVPITASDDWLALVFRAKAVAKGGVVRRSVAWVEEREVGRARFIDAVRRRGFHAIENGGQFIVIRDQGHLRVLC